MLRQLALTVADGERLAVVAALSGMSEGAYAAGVVEAHLRARWEGELAVGARQALGVLVARGAEVTALAQEVAAVGRLANQIARHVNIGARLPAGSTLRRIEHDLDVLRMRISGALDELDTTARALREQL
ncbi:hypothetical protein L6E12_20940 [Actinokineospora sp. PR83]|uniref:hypothetical protein n=1 Tax=Actinokineospora sp. PR83 TaxID=2884908 RepID=UPI001F21B04B|nr:hypothetical protein [Actinokineospora sp. PR83]MCG8918253.1 hypothetical protein [Actinokineospora sp. PR83]